MKGRVEAHLGPKRRKSLAALAMALAITAWGCGSSDEDKVAESVQAYLGALADGDGEEACSHLSGNGQRELVGFVSQQLPEIGTISCPEVVEQLSGTIGPDEKPRLEDAEVTNVEINGDAATATIEGATVSPMLVKSGDDWLIDSGFTGG
jgi:hypothetical protein